MYKSNLLLLHAIVCALLLISCQKQSGTPSSTDRQTVDKVMATYGFKPYQGALTAGIRQLPQLSLDEFQAQTPSPAQANTSKGKKIIDGGLVTNGVLTFTYSAIGDSLNDRFYYNNTSNSAVRFPYLESLHIPSIFIFNWTSPQGQLGGPVTQGSAGPITIWGKNLTAQWDYLDGIHQFVSHSTLADNLHYTGYMHSYLNVSGTVYTQSYLYDVNFGISAINYDYLPVHGSIGLTLQ